MELITSKDNPRVKAARTLNRKRDRYASRRFLIEGVRLIEEAVHRGAPLVEAFITPQLEESFRGEALARSLEQARVPLVEVTERVLASISETETPQGVVAVCRFHELPIGQVPEPFFLVVDGLRDPGNLGTILRTAQGAGIDCVYLLKGTADPWMPKVVRSAMGAHFAVPIRYIGSMDQLPPVDRVLIAEASGGTHYHEAEWEGSIALVIGGEAFGPGEEARARASGDVSIPTERETESLNVAVAASVILFEAHRQRSAGEPDS